jgi:hypothetical protein
MKNSYQKKIAFYSRGLEENLVQHSVNTKRSIKLISKVYSKFMQQIIWSLFKCKICQCWLYGTSEDRHNVLINNFQNSTKKNEHKKKMIKGDHLKNLKLSKLL